MSNTTEVMLSPEGMTSIIQFAEYMSQSGDMIPQHWRGNTGACMALLTQSMRWNMDPYAVANQAFSVNGTLGYSAQLVNAVIESSNVIQGGFHYEYSEGWEAINGKCEMGEVTKHKKGGGTWQSKEAIAKWKPADEQGLWVKVGAIKTGDADITWGEPLYLSGILIRNSPLWVTAPKQQIAYLAVKYWARLYKPSVIMGVYSADELPPREREEKDITGAGTTIKDLNPDAKPAQIESDGLDNFEDDTCVSTEDVAPEAEPEPKNHFSDTDEVLQEIAQAFSISELKAVLPKAEKVVSDDLEMVKKAYKEKGLQIKAAGEDL